MTLEVRDLHSHYGKSHVIQGVSLNVGAGELVTLLGRNDLVLDGVDIHNYRMEKRW